MKEILLLLLGFTGLFSSSLVNAQSFTVPHDTVWMSSNLINGGTPTIQPNDNITNVMSTGGLVLKWHVDSTNFPTEWLQSYDFGICDNNQCYSNLGDTLLWKVSTASTGNVFTSSAYPYQSEGEFSMSLTNLPPLSSSGCYYVTVTINDYNHGYSKAVTFIICNTATSVPTVKSIDDVLMYPNPATNELNVVYNANADVKNVAIYNVIGKVMTMYRVAGNSANLNLENIPSGIYFVRLINSHGDAVVTRKFTKQ